MTPTQLTDTPVVQNGLYLLLRQFTASASRLLAQEDIFQILHEFRQKNKEHALLENPLWLRLQQARIGAVTPELLFLGLREKPGKWSYLRFTFPDVTMTEIPAHDFLQGEALAVGANPSCPLRLHLQDFFYANNTANGLRTSLTELTDRLKSDWEHGVDILRVLLIQHQIGGQSLFLNKRIKTPKGLLKALDRAQTLLKVQEENTTWKRICRSMQMIGLEAGWGQTVAEMRTTIALLQAALSQPGIARTKRFFKQIACVGSIALVAPEISAGASDLKLKGPQKDVTYLCGLATSLEKQLEKNFETQGIPFSPRIFILCSASQKDVSFTLPGSRHVQVLGLVRANSLKTGSSDWEELERFARQAEVACLESRFIPDVAIGLNTTGGMAASFLSNVMDCPLVYQSFALQRSYDHFAAQNWQQGPSKQKNARTLLAELLTINRAGLILTHSTRQILGDEQSAGQYEMYQTFTLPELIQVEHGIDLSPDRFCPARPGIQKTIFFSYQKKDDRPIELQADLQQLLYGQENKQAQGLLGEKKPILLYATELQSYSDPEAILRWVHICPDLLANANIFLLSPPAKDKNEKRLEANLQKALDAFPEGIRWVQSDLDDILLGELYRMVADTRGIFVLPARFEGYSLHTHNALACGLPAFVSISTNGKDLVEHGSNGFHIDPTQEEECAQTISQFFSICEQDRSLWQKLSDKAAELAAKQGDWQTHAQQVLSGLNQTVFFSGSPNNSLLNAYLDLLYVTLRDRLPLPVPKSSKGKNGFHEGKKTKK